MSKIVHGPTEIQPVWPDRKCEYTAEILRLRAENEKLRAALKPFAEQYDAVEKEFGLLMLPDDANSIVRYADLRAAAAALKGNNES